MWTLVRQWRQKRVLMRPEAAFPYVSAAEGAQHPPKSRHAQRSAATKPTKAATLNGARPQKGSEPQMGVLRFFRNFVQTIG